jgi:hypothetical protein
MNKLTTFSRILKEYFLLGKNKDIIFLILKETKSLALGEKQYNQINPTYFDIITSLVHLNMEFFKTLDLKNDNEIKKIIDFIGVTNTPTTNVQATSSLTTGKIATNNFTPHQKTNDCGCN